MSQETTEMENMPAQNTREEINPLNGSTSEQNNPHNLTWDFSVSLIVAVVCIAHLMIDLCLAVRFSIENDYFYFLKTLLCALLPLFTCNPVKLFRVLTPPMKPKMAHAIEEREVRPQLNPEIAHAGGEREVRPPLNLEVSHPVEERAAIPLLTPETAHQEGEERVVTLQLDPEITHKEEERSMLICIHLFIRKFMQSCKEIFLAILKFVGTFEQPKFYARFFKYTRKKFYRNTDNRNYGQVLFELKESAIHIHLLDTASKVFQLFLQIIIVFQKQNYTKMDDTALLQKISIVLCIVRFVIASLEFKMFCGAVGLVSTIVDVCSDYYLFIEYLLTRQYLYAILTVTFILTASIRVTYKSNKSKKLKEQLPINSFKNIPIVIFNWEPIKEALKNIIFRIKMRINDKDISEREQFDDKRLEHKIRAADLKYYETLHEAAPQLTLRTSIFFLHHLKGQEFNEEATVPLLISAVSFIGCGIGILSYYKCWLQAVSGNKMSKPQSILMFLWYLLILVSRILSIGMLLAIYTTWTIVFIGIHWIFSFSYKFCVLQRQTKNRTFIDSLSFSIIYIFIPNPHDTKKEILWFSSILGIQNFCSAFYFICIIFFTNSFESPSKSESYISSLTTFYHIPSAISISCNILGNIFMVLFVYVFKFHVPFNIF